VWPDLGRLAGAEVVPVLNASVASGL
jgi:hypothetical protein